MMEQWMPTLPPEAQRAPRRKSEPVTTRSVAPWFSQFLCPKRHLPWKASGGRGSGHPSRNLGEQMAMTSHHQRLTHMQPQNLKKTPGKKAQTCESKLNVRALPLNHHAFLVLMV